MEEFRDIPNYKGYYKISNLGNVKSLERLDSRGYKRQEKMLKVGLTSSGYLSVNLSIDGKGKVFTIHQLLALTFLSHILNGMETVVDHKNNIKTDNRLENLQVISPRENCSKDKKGGSSKYVGVSWSRWGNKWISQIRVNSKVIFLGRFNNEVDASNAYQESLNRLN